MLSRIKSPWVTLILIAVSYLTLTVPAQFTTNHVLYNLEPYPDGLLYAVSARNFVLDKGLQLVYQGTTLPLWVPPLYAITLVPGYFISQAPQMFYLSNVLMGLATLIVLFHLGWQLSNSRWGGAVTTLVYISHAVIVWLPTVPMTENLIVLLFSLSLLAITEKHTSKYMYAVSLLATTGMILTRYSVFPVALSLICLQTWRLLQGGQKQLIYATVISALLILVLLEFVGIQSLSKILQLSESVLTTSQFYNLSFAHNNLISYLASVAGFSKQFLWLHVPLSSAFIAVPALCFGGLLLAKGTVSDKWQSLSLLLLFAVQFPLLLIFYTADSRYLILAVPILSLFFGWFSIGILSRRLSYGLVVIGICMLAHLFTQLTLFKEILTNNILHRSVAWQYEAIQQFNNYFLTETIYEPVLVTALPPHLVDAYQTTKYRVLPLSHHQEFLQKGEYVWGSDVPYDNLLDGYKLWLEQGKPLYITNAYITHQQAVIDDYEEYKQHFDFIPVSEGCLGACNIYKLELLSEASTPSAIISN